MLAAKTELENTDPATAPWVSFQLWGLDFMVDADFRVQLLEANVSPACAEALLPQFGEDFVHAVLDPLFPPQQQSVMTTAEAEDLGVSGGEATRHVKSQSKGGGDDLAFKRGFEVLWSPGEEVPGEQTVDAPAADDKRA